MQGYCAFRVSVRVGVVCRGAAAAAAAVWCLHSNFRPTILFQRHRLHSVAVLHHLVSRVHARLLRLPCECPCGCGVQRGRSCCCCCLVSALKLQDDNFVPTSSSALSGGAAPSGESSSC